MIRDMASSDEPQDQGEPKRKNKLLIMKGAPERIWGRCSHMLVNGEEVEKTEKHEEAFANANADLGKQGERVLAFARCYLDPSEYPEDFEFNMKKDNYNFPMSDLCFIGVVSLNDPPRMYVDHSVDVCRDAGIKVIMVTGDQPVTAAAIAKKVNIFSDGAIVNVDLIENGVSEEEALEQCTAVVVHGDELAMKHSSEAELDDDDPEKGRFMLNWIQKDEVVFARTTPSQKLLIVDACQKAGHVVAVTGDGVNDSPAIKKANIGIAMGSGSDVAKNAADMLLLDDNFSSIVNGVEEGRLIFDNLKKSIAYTLSSNIPEIAPFICFILLQVPLPLSTVLILCIDLGTDMVPAISMAYEGAELDIMTRKPRNSKRDHLVNSKLISFAYLQIGMIQASAGFYTYFLVMNDYGFKPMTLFGLAPAQGTIPGKDDVYNPAGGPCMGNTKCQEADEKTTLDFNSPSDNEVDARLFYHEFVPEKWSKCRFIDSSKFFKKSSVDDVNMCYSTEALRAAQCAYLVSIVCVQWADLMICKTRNLSISQQGMKNKVLNFGLVFETVLVAFLCYFKWINLPLGTRMIAPQHFAVPSFPYFTVIFFYDEGRKMLLRAGTDKEGKPKGWIIRNTYY